MMEAPVFELVVESDEWGSRRLNGTSLQEWEMDLGFLTQCGVLAKISSCPCHPFLPDLAPLTGCGPAAHLFLKTIPSNLNRFAPRCSFVPNARRRPPLGNACFLSFQVGICTNISVLTVGPLPVPKPIKLKAMSVCSHRK
jgi:hypothetical protein